MRMPHPLVLLPACVVAAGVAAADFDGSKPLICASQQVMDMASPKLITTGQPGDLGAPTFMRVDFEKKTITGPHRSTPIRLMDKDDKRIVLQGTELGLGWTLAVNAQDGMMIGSMVDADGVVVMFGECTPN
jgi:hypothetical protein